MTNQDIVVAPEIIIETVSTGPEAVDVLETGVSDIIEVGAKGEKGVKGDKGDKGDQGDQGVPGSGTFSYVHDQMIPSATWTIVHGLNGFPNVTVVDSSQREVVGDVTYVDMTTIIVTFAASFSGKAYLS